MAETIGWAQHAAPQSDSGLLQSQAQLKDVPGPCMSPVALLLLDGLLQGVAAQLTNTNCLWAW